MSMADTCTRRAGYEYLGTPTDLTGKDDLSTAVMQDGNMHEKDIVRLLLERGYDIRNFGTDQTWTVIKSPSNFWRGHPDLFLYHDNKPYGLEIKGYRTEVFDVITAGSLEVSPGIFHVTDPEALDRPSFSMSGQIQMYLHSEKAVKLGIDSWIVVIKNKNTSELAECIVPKMPSIIDNIDKRWLSFWTMMSVERLPNRNFEIGSIQCKLCPFRKRCWDGLSKLGDTTVEVPEVGEAVSNWRTGISMTKTGDKLVASAKLVFEQTALKVKSAHLRADDLTVNINLRSRSGIDKDHVENLLTILLREGVITKEQFDKCWTETEYIELRMRDDKPK